MAHRTGILLWMIMASKSLPAFGLWLDSPTRNNPNDPRSGAFHIAAPTPFFPTATTPPSPPPTASPAPSATASATPTEPAASAATSTCSATPSLTATPALSASATPYHSGIVTDFENNATSVYDDWTTDGVNYGNIIPNFGGGSTMVPAAWSVGAASSPGSNAGGASSGYCACFSMTNASGWAELDLELAYMGSTLATPNMVNVEPYAPGMLFQFDYKAQTVNGQGQTWTIFFLSPETFNGGGANKNWYRVNFTTAPDLNWHTAVIDLPNNPDAGLSRPIFAESPLPAIQYAWDAAPFARQVGVVAFSAPNAANLDICFDNIMFK
jgi:hypothetical protein